MIPPADVQHHFHRRSEVVSHGETADRQQRLMGAARAVGGGRAAIPGERAPRLDVCRRRRDSLFCAMEPNDMFSAWQFSLRNISPSIIDDARLLCCGKCRLTMARLR